MDERAATAAAEGFRAPAAQEPEAVAPGGAVGERRPGRNLLAYYFLQAIATGPGLIVLLPLRWFRYHTLRYTFDEQGVTMRWGILFRREISLTYARLQDIHLVSNVIERWLGLGRVQLQTASGRAGAEMVIEGLTDYEAIRDELYRRMRGARDPGANAPAAGLDAVKVDDLSMTELTAALREAAAELRRLREQLAAEVEG